MTERETLYLIARDAGSKQTVCRIKLADSAQEWDTTVEMSNKALVAQAEGHEEDFNKWCIWADQQDIACRSDAIYKLMRKHFKQRMVMVNEQMPFPPNSDWTPWKGTTAQVDEFVLEVLRSDDKVF